MTTLNNCKEIRIKVLDLAYISQEAHLGSCFSIIEFLYALYEDMQQRDADFLLSKGHAALAYYVILQHFGYISDELLSTYCKNGSILGAHPSKQVECIQFATGALGIGLSVGIGYAIHNGYYKKNKKTFVLLGDGELNEGSVWESLMYAGAKKLNTLIAVVDNNNLQATNNCSAFIPNGPLFSAIEKLGWTILSIDGHNLDEIQRTVNKCYENNNGPILIILKTIKGKGVGFIEDKVEWHHKNMTYEEYLLAKKLINE